MILQKIRLFQFRCYDEAEVSFDSKFNVIKGLNGQGKTSLIEAVGLVSFFKSFRGAKNNELIKLGAAESKIEAKVTHDDLEFDLGVKIWPNRKQASFNGKSCKYLSEYVGRISAVCFSPEDLEIIRGAPENRRNWIDKVAQIFSTAHVDAVSSYQQALDQRNRILKNFSQGKISKLTDDFEIWTDQIVEYGAKIIENRIVAADQSRAAIEEHYSTISNEKTALNLRYLQTNLDDEESRHLEAKEGKFSRLENLRFSLKNGLKNSLNKDCILGSTSIGPHRDDLEITMNGISAKSFGSQGEVRSVVLAMRLAETEKYREVRGYPPLLLIDDFSSELDSRRRKFLLAYLTESGSQVFLTTTEDIQLGKVFKVENGKIDQGRTVNDSQFIAHAGHHGL